MLVKRRGAIRKLDSVASWLYGVAARVSARARVDAARRRRSEAGAIRLAAQSVDQTGTADELDQALFGPIVQEEVSRLPEKYRSVILLCYWEGLTHEQAAAQLGCPLGTVRSRIARARDILRRRLTRRGLAPTAGVLAAVLGESSTRAAVSLGSVPPVLVRSSVQAALRVAAGQATLEVVSKGVATLVKHVTWSMAMMKYGTPALTLLMTATVATGLVTGAQQVRDSKRAAPQERSSRAAKPTAARDRTRAVQSLPHEYVVEPPDLLDVEVLEALPGRPISGERLVRPDGKISLGYYGEVYVAGLTLPEIKAKIVGHLTKYLSDDALGTTVRDSKTGREIPVRPEDNDRVLVDVATINSKFFYVQGEFNLPGRFPWTGKETILDAIDLAGGLAPQADRQDISLLRKNPSGGLDYNLTIHPVQVTEGVDRSHNYFLQPGDRLVAQRDPNYRGPVVLRESRPAREFDASPRLPQFGQAEESHDKHSGPDSERQSVTKPSRAAEPLTLRSLGKRLSAMESKLDRILLKLEDLDRQNDGMTGRDHRLGAQARSHSAD